MIQIVLLLISAALRLAIFLAVVAIRLSLIVGALTGQLIMAVLKVGQNRVVKPASYRPPRPEVANTPPMRTENPQPRPVQRRQPKSHW